MGTPVDLKRCTDADDNLFCYFRWPVASGQDLPPWIVGRLVYNGHNVGFYREAFEMQAGSPEFFDIHFGSYVVAQIIEGQPAKPFVVADFDFQARFQPVRGH
jgi:hypothetical protein